MKNIALDVLKRREALKEIQRCYQKGKGITLPRGLSPPDPVMDSETNMTQADRLLYLAINALKMSSTTEAYRLLDAAIDALKMSSDALKMSSTTEAYRLLDVAIDALKMSSEKVDK